MGVLLVTAYAVTAAAVRVQPPTLEVLHALLLSGVPEMGAVNSANILFTRTRAANYPGIVDGTIVIGSIQDAAFASW